MTKDKPTVKFLGNPEFHRIEITSNEIRKEFKKYLDDEGCYEKAVVFGLDHPILGRDTIHTSIVVKKNDDGSFETMNTLYVPEKETNESK
jgi:hypothetical protein